MFDFAWSELALIAVVALVVIGPKDLPRVMRTVATYVRKARAIAREFQGHVEDMVREAELEEVRKEVEKAAKLSLPDEFAKTVDPTGELQAAFSDPVLTNPTTELPAPPPEPVALPEGAIKAPAPRQDEGAAPAPAPTHHQA
jgi:sec-independent protein translocase protein TatB